MRGRLNLAGVARHERAAAIGRSSSTCICAQTSSVSLRIDRGTVRNNSACRACTTRHAPRAQRLVDTEQHVQTSRTNLTNGVSNFLD